MNRLPSWLRQEIPDLPTLKAIDSISQIAVNTVCQEARCPNRSFCFRRGQFTFMILGNTCTRNCRFCAVEKANNKILTLDDDEPLRISRIVKELGLRYVVITSVSRDDLGDGGAGHFVKTIEAIRKLDRSIKIEILIPDFSGNMLSLHSLLNAAPDVLGHNLESVPRLYPELRPQADYRLSLDVLSQAKIFNPALITKSALILGLGESEEEVTATMQDLRQSQCDILTLGQYLAPSPEQVAVKEFISPQQFLRYREIALGLGFKAVWSAPLVRSSYQAQRLFEEACCV